MARPMLEMDYDFRDMLSLNEGIDYNDLICFLNFVEFWLVQCPTFRARFYSPTIINSLLMKPRCKLVVKSFHDRDSWMLVQILILHLQLWFGD